jgi:hypothetical protein
MIRKIIAVAIMALVFGVLIYIDHNACNTPGSIAEKINWAGHNCPRE